MIRKTRNPIAPRLNILRDRFLNGDILTRKQISLILEFNEDTSISCYLNLLSRHGLWIEKEKMIGSKKYQYKAKSR